jgi:hypothetical protein
MTLLINVAKPSFGVIQYPRYLNLETQDISCSPGVILNFGRPIALDNQSASVFE